MDAKLKPPTETAANCQVPDDKLRDGFDAAPPWSDLWQREIASIRRAQRITYLVAGIVAAIALTVMVLPNLLG